jgi:cobalt/nickel transport system ATP-binding protein
VVLELRAVEFAYPGGEAVLRGIDFHLAEGQRVALLGANGAGKSTLLMLLVGLLRPQGGEVLFRGRPCRGEEDFHLVRQEVGLLFQDPEDQLFCPTVEEDVAFGPLNLGLSHQEAARRAEEALRDLGIAHLAPRPVQKLSGGEKRLVALAGLLAMRPRVLLLDEPTAGLEEAARERLLRCLNHGGLGYVVVSHDREFLAQSTRGAWLLQDGRLRRLKEGTDERN